MQQCLLHDKWDCEDRINVTCSTFSIESSAFLYACFSNGGKGFSKMVSRIFQLIIIPNMLCLSSSDKLKIKDKQLNKELTFEEIIKRDVGQVFFFLCCLYGSE